MESKMEIIATKRNATESDTDFALKTHHAAYRDVTVKQFGSWDEGMQDKFFMDAWKPEEYEILNSNGVDCGYISIERKPEYIFVHELVLLPEFQGRGIGGSIMRDVIQEASSKSIPARLQVLKENQAQNLYRKLGFKDIEITDTHIKMEFNPNI